VNQIRVDLDTGGPESAIADVAKLQQRVEQLAKSFTAQNKEANKGAKAARGSYAALEKELRDNIKALKQMEVGSKAFDIQRAKVNKLERSLASAKGQMKAGTTAAQGLRSAASGAVSQIVGIAAGVAGVQAAITAVVGELEKAKNLELKASRQELTLEAALADIGLNVGGDQISAAREMIESNAQGLGTTQEGLANLLGVAISAGAKDLTEAMEVSSAALQMNAGDAGAAATFVGSALDIASLSESDNFEGALGQVAQVQSQVRSVNAAEFFQNIGPALAAATADRTNVEGVTTERALEISSVFSQVLKDFTGANTATAVRQFVTRLDSFTPELTRTLKDGTAANLTADQIKKFKAAGTVDERVDLFRGNEALRRQFLDQQKEGIGKGAISEFIEGTDRALKTEAKAAAAITSLDDGVQSFTGLVAGVEAATGLLRADRTSAANIEALQTNTTGAQSQGAVRKLLNDTLGAVNLPGIDSLQIGLANKQLDIANAEGKDPVAEVREFLNAVADGGLEGFSTGSLSERDAEFIRTQVEVLNKIEAHLASRTKVKIEAPPQGPRPIRPAAAAAP